MNPTIKQPGNIGNLEQELRGSLEEDLGKRISENEDTLGTIIDNKDQPAALALLADVYSQSFLDARRAWKESPMQREERYRRERMAREVIYSAIKQRDSYLQQVAVAFEPEATGAVLNVDNLLSNVDARIEFAFENSRDLRENTTRSIKVRSKKTNRILIRQNEYLEIAKAAYSNAPEANKPGLLEGLRAKLEGMELAEIQHACEYHIRMLKLYSPEKGHDVGPALDSALELYRTVLALRASVTIPSTDLKITEDQTESSKEAAITTETEKLISFQKTLSEITGDAGMDYFDTRKIEGKDEKDVRVRQMNAVSFVDLYQSVEDMMAKTYRILSKDPKFKEYIYVPETPISFDQSTKIYGLSFEYFMASESEDGDHTIYKFTDEDLARATVDMIRRNSVGIFIARQNLYELGTHVEQYFTHGRKMDPNLMALLLSRFTKAELLSIQLLHSLNKLLIGDRRNKAMGLRDALKKSGLYKVVKDGRQIKRQRSVRDLMVEGLTPDNENENPLANALRNSQD